MKRLRLITAMITVVLVIFSLTACKAPDIVVESGTVRIGVIDRGYGKQFAYDLAKDFSEKTNYKAMVVMDTAESGALNKTMEMGLDNSIDVYFSESAPLFQWLSRKGNVVPGYDPVLADLSDVLDAPADPAYSEAKSDATLTNRDLFSDVVLDSLTGEDGKVYALPWTADVTGMYYNHRVLEALNARADVNPKIELPKTTTEMFELFDRVKNLKVTNSATNKRIYPLKFGNQHNYLDNCAFTTWFAQYAGQTGINNFLQGKNAEGVYTPEIFKDDARLASLEVMQKMLAQSSGYAASEDYALHIFMAQDQFVEGDALFHFNGGWFEREQSLKYEQDEYDARYLKTPVVSSIVNKFPEVFNGATAADKDLQLRQVLDFIDGDTEQKPAILNGHDDVLESLKASRNTISSKGIHMNTFIPAYSENLDASKAFVKYLLSKQGQEVMLKGSYGNITGLKVDPSQFDYWKTASETSKSRLTVFTQLETVANFVHQYPMEYLSGLTYYRDGVSPQKTFASSSAPSATEYMEAEYSDYFARWQNMMNTAGLKN